ncbi:hypothetical protein N9937_01360 [bacterium]|nr:hypothetical protein [bacterium]
MEFEGECVVQQWAIASVVLRRRQICDLPSPTEGEVQVKDREAMKVNPFPGLLDRNDADSLDPDLLEKNTGRKPNANEAATHD